MSAEWETTDEAFHAGLSKLPTALGEWQRLRKKLASAHRRFARPPYKSLRQVGSYEFGGDERTLRERENLFSHIRNLRASDCLGANVWINMYD